MACASSRIEVINVLRTEYLVGMSVSTLDVPVGIVEEKAEKLSNDIMYPSGFIWLTMEKAESCT